MSDHGNMRLLVTGGSGFIGTNLMEHYIGKGVPLINLDWNPPLNKAHVPHWKACDLMDPGELDRAFVEFAPTHVVHLAARTDTEEPEDVDAYRQNHEGTRILLDVVKTAPSVERIIVTSTQFVCEAGYQPKHDQDYKPFTVYGESKRRTELVTREAGLPCSWTLIRPTTIWGPWSLRYRDVMFKVMRKGMYFHPGRKKVVRSYGYVGNVVWQIDRMLLAPREMVDGRVFYVGDQPVDLKVWVEAVSRALTGKPVRYIPTWIVKALAFCGDVLKLIRIPFPITSGRFRSMTTDYITPMDRTIDALGDAPYSMEDGIRRTIEWYDRESGGVTAGELMNVPCRILKRSMSISNGSLPKRDVLTTRITIGSFEQQINAVLDHGAAHRSSYVCCVNAHMTVEARDPSFALVVHEAELATPDGMPVLFVLRWFHKVRQERVAGNDMLPAILDGAANRGLSIFLYGGTDEVQQRMIERTTREYPTLRIAGAYAPPFAPLEAMDLDAEAARINASGAHIVMVSLGCPKQERWMSLMKGRVNAVMLGLGGAFLLYAGVDTRAPSWMRRLSLEWLYRMALEPRRLWKRYMITNTIFLWLFMKAMVSTWFKRKATSTNIDA